MPLRSVPFHLFRRVTSGGAVLAELDGLRAVAILPVVLFHAMLSLSLKSAAIHGADGGGAGAQVSSLTGDADVFRSPLGWIVGHGFLGAQLFFVISGFVVVLPFARARLFGDRRPSLGRFYLKRLTRIEPPYVIALAAFFVGTLVAAPENARLADYLAGLFLMTLGAFRSRVVRRVLSVPVVSTVGGACYTIYLLHFLMVSLFGRFIAPFATQSFELNLLLLALPFAIAVTFACLCLFPLVERPFMHGDWPARLRDAVRTRSLAPLRALFA